MEQAVLHGHGAHATHGGTGFGAALSGIFSSLGNAIRLSREWESRALEMRRLQTLSDAELAGKGIARDRIPQHVFHELFAD